MRSLGGDFRVQVYLPAVVFFGDEYVGTHIFGGVIANALAWAQVEALDQGDGNL